MKRYFKKTVSIPPSETQEHVWEVTADEAGTWLASVNGLSQNFSVIAKAVPDVEFISFVWLSEQPFLVGGSYQANITLRNPTTDRWTYDIGLRIGYAHSLYRNHIDPDATKTIKLGGFNLPQWNGPAPVSIAVAVKGFVDILFSQSLGTVELITDEEIIDGRLVTLDGHFQNAWTLIQTRDTIPGEVFFLPTYHNAGNTFFIGHVSLRIDGVDQTAMMNQDMEAAPGTAVSVQFAPVVLSPGAHQIDIELSSGGQQMDTMSLTLYGV